jgi:hypothetical protein
MVKKTLFLFLFTLLLLQVRAQQRAPDDAFPRYKWEVGTDLLFFTKWRNVPPSLFVRLNTGSRAAWRFRVGGNYSEHLNPLAIDTSLTGTTQIKTNLIAFASTGREWQRQMGRFQFFYGSDIFTQYFLRRAELAIVLGKDYFPKDKEFSIGVSPFLGVKFFIHPQVSLSAESHIDLYYYSFKRENFAHNGYEFFYSDFKLKYFKTDFDSPIYVLNLMFHF